MFEDFIVDWEQVFVYFRSKSSIKELHAQGIKYKQETNLLNAVLYVEGYLEPSRTSMVKRLRKNSSRLLGIDYSRRKAPL